MLRSGGQYTRKSAMPMLSAASSAVQAKRAFAVQLQHAILALGSTSEQTNKHNNVAPAQGWPGHHRPFLQERNEVLWTRQPATQSHLKLLFVDFAKVSVAGGLLHCLAFYQFMVVSRVLKALIST